MSELVAAALQNMLIRVLSRVDSLARDPEATPRSRAILVSSVRPGEGKSFVAEALARHAAMLTGQRVLLVDANLDRPQVHRRFDVPEEPGLSEALESAATAEPAEPLATIETAVPNLFVLPCGRAAPAGILYRLPALGRLLDAACRDFDLVVLDGGALQLAGSALVNQVGGILLVIDASRTRREVVSGTLSALSIDRRKIHGAVLNKRPQYIPRWLYRYL